MNLVTKRGKFKSKQRDGVIKTEQIAIFGVALNCIHYAYPFGVTCFVTKEARECGKRIPTPLPLGLL